MATEGDQDPVVSANLRKLMKRKGIKGIGALREAMAAQGIKIGAGTIQRALEGGDRNRVDTLGKLAQFFDVTTDQLLQVDLGLEEPAEDGAPVPPGKEFGNITPKEQAMLDELLLYFRDLLPSDRTTKLAELRALAKVRAAERQEMLEEAGMRRIMEKAANATRRQTETATSAPRFTPPVIDPNAPELPHIPPPDEDQ